MQGRPLPPGRKGKRKHIKNSLPDVTTLGINQPDGGGANVQTMSPVVMKPQVKEICVVPPVQHSNSTTAEGGKAAETEVNSPNSVVFIPTPSPPVSLSKHLSTITSTVVTAPDPQPVDTLPPKGDEEEPECLVKENTEIEQPTKSVELTINSDFQDKLTKRHSSIVVMPSNVAFSPLLLLETVFEQVPEIPEQVDCVIGEDAAQLHKIILKTMRKVFNKDKMKMEDFKINARLFGNGFMESSEYIDYFVRAVGPLKMLVLVPCLLQLQSDPIKKKALIFSAAIYRSSNMPKLLELCENSKLNVSQVDVTPLNNHGRTKVDADDFKDSIENITNQKCNSDLYSKIELSPKNIDSYEEEKQNEEICSNTAEEYQESRIEKISNQETNSNLVDDAVIPSPIVAQNVDEYDSTKVEIESNFIEEESGELPSEIHQESIIINSNCDANESDDVQDVDDELENKNLCHEIHVAADLYLGSPNVVLVDEKSNLTHEEKNLVDQVVEEREDKSNPSNEEEMPGLLKCESEVALEFEDSNEIKKRSTAKSGPIASGCLFGFENDETQSNVRKISPTQVAAPVASGFLFGSDSSDDEDDEVEVEINDENNKNPNKISVGQNEIKNKDISSGFLFGDATAYDSPCVEANLEEEASVCQIQDGSLLKKEDPSAQPRKSPVLMKSTSANASSQHHFINLDEINGCDEKEQVNNQNCGMDRRLSTASLSSVSSLLSPSVAKQRQQAREFANGEEVRNINRLEDVPAVYGGFRVMMNSSQEQLDHDSGKFYTEYLMNCSWTETDGNTKYWTSVKRYREFCALDLLLREKYPQYAPIFPNLPGKKYLGSSLSAEFVDKRQRDLGVYISDLVQKFSTLIHDETIDEFLEIKRHVMIHSREKKHRHSGDNSFSGERQQI